MAPLRLVIAVPTYNRHEPLAALLESLGGEPEVVGGEVVVQVLDNASTDATDAILRERASRSPWLRHHRHPANIGGVANIRAALQVVAKFDYVWVLSDHMIVRPGAVGRLLRSLKMHRPEAVCAGIGQYAALLGSTEFVDQPDRMDVSRSAALYFHFSNISSVVAAAALVEKAGPLIADCGRHSYPHLGLWAQIRASGSGILFVPDLSRFSAKGGKGYAWFASGVLDYAETIRLTHDEDRAAALLKATGAMPFYRNTVFRHLVGVRAGLVRECVSSQSVERACRDFRLSAGGRALLRIALRLPRRVAVSLSRYFSGPRGAKTLVLAAKRGMTEPLPAPVLDTSSLALQKFD